MSIPARKHLESLLGAIVKAFNEDRKARVSTNVHYSPTAIALTGDPRNPSVTAFAISAANASDLATSLTLAKEIRAKLQYMALDDVAHKVQDPTFASLAAEPNDLATAITFANDAKAKYGVHIASTTYHATADATNTIAAANASDQSSLNTLLNELKTDINAHVLAALAGYSVRIMPA